MTACFVHHNHFLNTSRCSQPTGWVSAFKCVPCRCLHIGLRLSELSSFAFRLRQKFQTCRHCGSNMHAVNWSCFSKGHVNHIIHIDQEPETSEQFYATYKVSAGFLDVTFRTLPPATRTRTHPFFCRHNPINLVSSPIWPSTTHFSMKNLQISVIFDLIWLKRATLTKTRQVWIHRKD